MIELIAEILIYLIVAALLGLILGYLVWGWGRRRKIAAARADGAASVRTSVDGDTSLRKQLDTCSRERARLEETTIRQRDQIGELEAELADLRGAEATEPVEPPVSVNQVQPLIQTTADPEPVLQEPIPEPAKSGIAEIRTDDSFSRRLAGLGSGDDEPAHQEPEIASLSEEATDTADQDPAIEPLPDTEPSGPLTAPASLLADRPDEVDDLKRIKGVGPVMEQVLNDKGVYLFHQVANFSAADVAWVNEAIEAFPGRIERDNWVGQAQDLYHEKYGRAHSDSD